MQPKSRIKYNKEEIKTLNVTIKNAVKTKRMLAKNSEYATPVPEFVSFKLTNRCNLRCKHCYQWNETGYHNFMDVKEQKEELDLYIIKHVLEETHISKARLYLWGGEPLLYSKMSDLVKLLENDIREVSMCTNGLLIEKNLNVLLKIPKLELVVAVEGFKEDHDTLRGSGSFEKTMNNIARLIELRKKGIFKGKITIHTMINDSLVSHLFNLLLFLEELGVDMVIICYPWYISNYTSKKMDDYFHENFSWLNELNKTKKANWHAFKYRLNQNSIKPLRQQMELIKSRIWNLRLRYQPDLEKEELEDFIEGKDTIGSYSPQCVGLSTRLDIEPDGSVIACKFFSEYNMGNLHENRLQEIWNSNAYKKVRKIINTKSTPVCTKCSELYLHGN